MNQTPDLSFGDAKARFEVTLLRLSYPQAIHPRDSGTLEARLVASTEHFSAALETTLFTFELQRLEALLRELDEAVGAGAREVAWSAMDGAAKLTLRLNALGHLALRVELCPNTARPERMVLQLDTDQTVLGPWREQLKQALSRFP